MAAVKDVINRMEKTIKTKSRKGVQSLTQTVAQLKGKIRTTAGRVGSKLSSGKGGEHK